MSFDRGEATKALLFLGGDPPPFEAVLPHLQGSLVVAADSGALLAWKWRIAPHWVVGDMDSVPQGVLGRLKKEKTRLERHPKDKRDTDSVLSYLRALKEGAREIVLVGATGGRLDHTLANLALCHRILKDRRRVLLLERDWEGFGVSPSFPLTLRAHPGSLLSVLPLGGGARGVTLRGFRWNLEGERMDPYDPYGISNVIEKKSAEIGVQRGALLVLLHRWKEPPVRKSSKVGPSVLPRP